MTPLHPLSCRHLSGERAGVTVDPRAPEILGRVIAGRRLPGGRFDLEDAFTLRSDDGPTLRIAPQPSL